MLNGAELSVALTTVSVADKGDEGDIAKKPMQPMTNTSAMAM